MVQLKRELNSRLSFSADDEEEEVMSNMSDSEEEDPNTLFTYKRPPTSKFFII